MKKIPYEARAQRLGISCVGLSPRQIMEAMAAELLRRHKPGQSDNIIRALPDTPDAALILMLDTLEADDRIIYSENNRQPEMKAILYSRVIRLTKDQALTDAAAARIVYAPASGEAFRKLKKCVGDLEKQRETRREQMLGALLDRFKNDKQAMRLWGEFCAADIVWRRGYATYHLGLSIEAGNRIDKIFGSRHPFATGLVLLFASAQDVWWHLGPFFERIADGEKRHKLFAECGRKTLSERQTIDATLDLLHMFGLFPSNGKRKRMRRT
jgi:hypothetical protein